MDKNSKLVCIAELPHELVPDLLRAITEFAKGQNADMKIELLGVSGLTKEEFVKMVNEKIPGFAVAVDTGFAH